MERSNSPVPQRVVRDYRPRVEWAEAMVKAAITTESEGRLSISSTVLTKGNRSIGNRCCTCGEHGQSEQGGDAEEHDFLQWAELLKLDILKALLSFKWLRLSSGFPVRP